MIISIIVLGTGKSFLLSKIVSSLKNIYGDEKVAVTATTGIAAININVITLHSFAGVGLGIMMAPKLPILIAEIEMPKLVFHSSRN